MLSALLSVGRTRRVIRILEGSPGLAMVLFLILKALSAHNPVNDSHVQYKPSILPEQVVVSAAATLMPGSLFFPGLRSEQVDPAAEAPWLVMVWLERHSHRLVLGQQSHMMVVAPLEEGHV